MDPLALATAVVNLLIPYLSKMAEKLADKAADTAWQKLEALFATVKQKFAGNVYAEETLKRVNDEPQSTSRQTALVGVLEEEIRNDPEFAETLRALLNEARESNIETIIQTIAVSGHARTGKITTIGKVDGNVDLSK